MTLEATFRGLSVCLHQLHDALNTLHVTQGDKPPAHELALADDLEIVVLEMMGMLHEMRTAAAKAREALGPPVALDRVRRALTICQERFHRIEQQFAVALVSHEKLKELERFGSELRGEWLAWSSSVKQEIEQCRPPVEQTSVALASCWQELTECLAWAAGIGRGDDLGRIDTLLIECPKCGERFNPSERQPG